MSRILASALMLATGVLAGNAFAQANLPEKLFLAEIRVEGNTVLPQAEVERSVMPFLGPDRPSADVRAAGAALAKAFERAGYLSATVEPLRLDPVDTQWGKGWVVVLKVSEGPVARLKVTGSQFNSPGVIREAVPSAAEGKTLNFNEFQDDLARAARLNSASVTPVLRPGRDPGTMEVELKVQDELPGGAWAELTNDQSPGTTPRRLELGAHYDNLFQKQHSLSLRGIVTPLDTNEIKVLTLNYGLPLDGDGDRLSLYVVNSDSQIGVNTGTGVIGAGVTVGARVSMPLRGSPGFFHNLTFGADYKNLREDSSALGSRPLKYMPLAAQYLTVWSGDTGTWTLSNSFTAGIGGLIEREISDCQGHQVDQFACRRAGASSSFLVWGGSLKREQKLDALWLDGWRLDARFDWQMASSPLITNEQFYVGGRDSVRGYLQSEQGGDDGTLGSLELLTPNLLPESWKVDTRIAGFWDAGWVSRQQPLAGEISDWRLIGAGLGLRMSLGKNVIGSIDWARTKLPGSTTPDEHNRVHARLRLEY